MTKNTSGRINKLPIRLFGYSALATVMLGAGLSPYAQAADAEKADNSVLEEITVTVQKRRQNLQDVGIALAAFSGNSGHWRK